MSGAMSAVVRMRPGMDDFRKELKTEVEKAGKQAAKDFERTFERAGKAAGSEVGDGIEKGSKAGIEKGGRAAEREAPAKFRRAGDAAGKAVGDGIEKGVRKSTTRTTADMQRSLSNVSNKMMMGGAVMTAGLTAPMVMYATAAAQTAMDHQDTMGAIEQTYGEGTARINRWLEGTAGKFQLSQSTAAAGVFSLSGYMTGMYGETAKAGDQAAATMERLADATAHYGGKIEDKVSAFTSAMNGSFEPLETQFQGTAMRMSEVAAHASEMGLLEVNEAALSKAVADTNLKQEKANKLRAEGKAGTAEYRKALAEVELAKQKEAELSEGAAESMSQEVRWLATQDLFMRKTAKAQGAINRERDSATGGAREAKKAWDDLKLTLGDKLLPIIAELAPKFAEMFEELADDGTLESLIPAIESLARTLVDLMEKFTDLPQGVQEAILGFAAFGGPTISMVGALGKVGGGAWNAAGKLRGMLGAGQAAASGASAASGAASGAAGSIGGMTTAAGAANGVSLGGLVSSLGAVGTAAALAATAVASVWAGLQIGEWGWDTDTGRGILDRVATWGPTRGLINGIASITGDDRRIPEADKWVPLRGQSGKVTPNYDSGGVHPGPFGVHTPAMVAGGEIVLPTHRYPVAEAAARVGLGGMLGGTQTFAPSVTNHIYAAPGMDVNALAAKTGAVTGEALDQVSRRAAARTMRPAQNRRT